MLGRALRTVVNVRTPPRWTVPLLLFGLCGVAGMAVDVLGILASLDIVPWWFNRLDVLVAVAFTVGIGGMDAYRRGRR